MPLAAVMQQADASRTRTMKIVICRVRLLT